MEIKHKSVIDEQFRHDGEFCSPTREDYLPVIEYDKSGDPFVVFNKVDYSEISSSLGVVSDWSLKSLINAGIDPKFGIHTGNSTNLENSKVVKQFADAIEAEVTKSE